MIFTMATRYKRDGDPLSFWIGFDVGSNAPAAAQKECLVNECEPFLYFIYFSN